MVNFDFKSILKFKFHRLEIRFLPVIHLLAISFNCFVKWSYLKIIYSLTKSALYFSLPLITFSTLSFEPTFKNSIDKKRFSKLRNVFYKGYISYNHHPLYKLLLFSTSDNKFSDIMFNLNFYNFDNNCIF